jgi:hypothetical protein
VGKSINAALNLIAPHIPNLSSFFEEYDCYQGRIFAIWELKEIFNYKVNEKIFFDMGEEN